MLIGIIAFALPVLVVLSEYLINNQFGPLTSISAYYHTAGRNVFVGSLFIVGAFLISYQGWYDESIKDKFWLSKQGLLSKIAGVAAIFVALFPTKCNLDCYCVEICDEVAIVHGVSALVLFSVLFIFSVHIFQYDEGYASPGRVNRNRMYKLSTIGYIIAGCIGVAHIFLQKHFDYFIFAAEFIALWSFGLAWFTSSKVFPWLKDLEISQK